MKNVLTPKQRTFVDEYLIDVNATQAAVRAGYSPRTAKVIGSQNLTKLNIQKAIRKAMDARAARTEVTADMVVAELAKPAFVDIRQIFTPAGNLRSPHELSADVAAAIQSIEVVVRPTGEIDEDGSKVVEHVHKIRFHDKIRPLELLGRHLGLFSTALAAHGDVNIVMHYGNGNSTEMRNGVVKKIRNGITVEG